jgi:disulfide bond formation protein DsbB
MINPFRASFRIQFLLGFLACAGVLAYAFHTQFRDVNPLDPCPLCIFQRIAFFALGVVFLLGALHGPARRGWRRVYGVLALMLRCGHRGGRSPCLDHPSAR